MQCTFVNQINTKKKFRDKQIYPTFFQTFEEVTLDKQIKTQTQANVNSNKNEQTHKQKAKEKYYSFTYTPWIFTESNVFYKFRINKNYLP